MRAVLTVNGAAKSIHAEQNTGSALWQRSSFRISAIAVGLAFFGLVMVASAAGSRHFMDATLKRIGLTGVGLWVFLLGARLDYQWWRRHHLAVLAAATCALVAVLVPGMGVARNNATRWLDVGLPVTFQPSEFSKLALCFWLAAYCERNVDKMKTAGYGFLMPMAVVGGVCALILAEPDFGTAVLVGIVASLVLWVMGTRTVFFLLAAVATMPLAQHLIIGVPYRMRRITSFLDPWADPLGAGYQLIQSKIAIGTGGLVGTGLGLGRQSQGFLPLAQSDFIFSIVAEELGFIGAVVPIAAFVLLLWEGLKVTSRARDPFAFALSLGLTSLLGLQAAIHIAVATGAVPTKGLSMPFISAGGSSLLTCMLAAGILANVARSEEAPDEHELKPWAEQQPAYEKAAARAARRLYATARGLLTRTNQ